MKILLPVFGFVPSPSHSVVLVGVVEPVPDHELDWLEVDVEPVPNDALPPLKNISTA